MNADRFLTVAFNPHKHHLGFLKKKIQEWRDQHWKEVEQEMLCIGTNLIDVYYGRLTVRQIYEETTGFADKAEITDATKLDEWLGHDAYRKLMLSDGSFWVIRQGLNPESFLHIHPAKHSNYTVRIRASTLKTVVALKICIPDENENHLNLEMVNQVRTEILNLSPVKKIQPGKGIARIWNLFSKQIP
jgi:hypothetical protein